MHREKLWRLVLLFALVGILAAGYSTYAWAFPRSTGDACTPGSVRIGYLGSMLGVPADPLVLLWFTLVGAQVAGSGLLPAALRRALPRCLFGLSIAGLVVVLHFGQILLQQAGAIACTPCLIIGGAILAIFILSAVAEQPNDGPGAAKPPWTVALGVTAIELLFLLVPPLLLLSRKTGDSRDALATPEKLRRWASTQPRAALSAPPGSPLVVIAEFNDYQCPYSKKAFGDYGPVLAKFVAEHPGDVVALSKDYPLESECNLGVRTQIHPLACEAAVSVRLARSEGRERPMKEWLFENQRELSMEGMKKALEQLTGRGDFDDRYATTLEDVRADVALAQRLGVSGTPTFFINGLRVPQGLSASRVAALIGHELNHPFQPGARQASR